MAAISQPAVDFISLCRRREDCRRPLFEFFDTDSSLLYKENRGLGPVNHYLKEQSNKRGIVAGVCCGTERMRKPMMIYSFLMSSYLMMFVSFSLHDM